MEKKQAFKALSKICLNNWHYIDRRVLSLNQGVNFFTGHSGSGKSTVIDALQIVLYANTDGRGFFNKAAADDSDRSLIEYLRGMVNIGDNNEFQYLRNKNFSSTIVIELENTDTREKQCVGIVFDVETATNEISRLFFWHKGGLLENHYRAEKRCLTTYEIKEYLQRNFSSSEDYYYGSSNERFRRQLYDVYLGGLDSEKFPRLFKRAIPFKMNIKLEEFVKEYICMEQNLHIEDLQESITQYGRMRGMIEETLSEIQYLQKIEEKYGEYVEQKEDTKACSYQIARLEILSIEDKMKELEESRKQLQQELVEYQGKEENVTKEQKKLELQYEEILLKIASSGYEALKKDIENLNESLERLEHSKARWLKTAGSLKEWQDVEVISNQTLRDIEAFKKQKITAEQLERLKQSLVDARNELEEELRETDAKLRLIKKEEKSLKEELQELKQGRKAYPSELEEARYELRNRLQEQCGKFVNVQILADLLDVRDETWHNAIEGYLGNNKLLLVVEPQYAKMTMEIYQNMDKRKFFKASILDTEKVMEQEWEAKKGSLAEELKVKEDYIQSYIHFILGNVMKCENISELRQQKIGITADCILYKSFRLQHINPENYTKKAFIGERSTRQRIRQLEERIQTIQNERLPLQELIEKIKHSLRLEFLGQPMEDYLGWLKDIGEIPEKEQIKQELLEKMKKLKDESVTVWEEEKEEIQNQQNVKKDEFEKVKHLIWKNQEDTNRLQKIYTNLDEQLKERENEFQSIYAASEQLEEDFQLYLEKKRTRNYESLMKQRIKERQLLEKKCEDSYETLIEVRSEYVRKYPNRDFSATLHENEPYSNLLKRLQFDELEKYQEAANIQANHAIEHFKEDFIYKIRYAIKEAVLRKDELNRIISKLNFGKDKYQFVITKNQGPDGRFYRMFMDEALSIHPSKLRSGVENQMNMFSMEHEEEYGELMNELIEIFIPPQNATREELDEAKRNMEKYADYRTYLSFDMQQIIQGEKDMKIGLSKMIRKNSGGEGQNPLYVALLASFAQIYRINDMPRIRRPETLRLVILDEAFSKMDAEKVASCISLIRGLGFQAIISATNDKIQNYLENVDKTFVYANPDKKHISIQEFEREEFLQLQGEE